MKRRHVLGLIAGSAAASATIGTEAFSSVRAQRAVSVDVVDDANGYLRLGPCTDDDGSPLPNGQYARELDNGTISIDLTADNDQVAGGGEGVNAEALTRFLNVFEVCNQGTQPVCVDLALNGGDRDTPEIPGEVPERFDFEQGDPAIVFYRGDNPDEEFDFTRLDPNNPEAVHLDVGDCQCFGFDIRTFGFTPEDTLLADTDLSIVADANADCTGDEDDEDDESTLFDAEDISFIAFCDDGSPEVTAIEAVEFKDEDGEPGGPVSVEFETVDPVEEIVLFIGTRDQVFLVRGNGFREGTITTREDEEVPEDWLQPDKETEDDETERTQSEPCDPDEDWELTKFDWEEGDFVKDED